MTAGKLRLSRPPLAPEKLGWFRWGRVAGKVLLTNDVGEWLFLEEADFRSFLAGGLPAEHPKYAGLQERGFLRDNLDAEELARRLRKKKRFLGQGPHLAIVITTLRCNQSCRYCHASRTDMERVDTDMSLATARKVVDHALQTPSPYLCFEYQGGEPTVNFDALRFCVEYSREKNRVEKKSLDHSLVTNMTWMNEERAEWLLQNGVLLCTSLDGSESVHNQNRPWTGNKAAAFETVIGWMKHINRRYVELGRDPELWHVDALSTTTRASLSAGRELVDLYVEMGIRNVHLRPLNPFGFATKTWKAIGYTMEEWLDWYRATLDYIIELNLQGVQIMEGTAALFLKKILTPEDPNFVDLRSPVGSGSGQITYGYDGTIYPSDEGRMVAAMGDPIFALGHVDSLSMAEALRHPTVRALAASSLLDALPQCVDCWNAPYCGVRPEHNYMMDGDLFSQRPLTPKHTQHLAIATHLFEKLAHDSDGRIETIFRRWTVDRPRDA